MLNIHWTLDYYILFFFFNAYTVGKKTSSFVSQGLPVHLSAGKQQQWVDPSDQQRH